jgi:hypothetical protein
MGKTSALTRAAFTFLGSGKQSTLQLKAWCRGGPIIAVPTLPPLVAPSFGVIIAVQSVLLLCKSLPCIAFLLMSSTSRFKTLRLLSLVHCSKACSQLPNMPSYRNKVGQSCSDRICLCLKLARSIVLCLVDASRRMLAARVPSISIWWCACVAANIDSESLQ